MSMLYITEKAWHQIEHAVKEMPSKETGGVLMGYSVNHSDQLITFASGPGPNAVHQQHSVILDDTYLRRMIRRKSTLSTYGLKYLGDWHSHTVKRLSPSRVDKITLQQKALQSSYASHSPLMLIAGISKKNQVQARAFTLSTNSIHEVQRFILLNKSILAQLAKILESPYGKS